MHRTPAHTPDAQRRAYLDGLAAHFAAGKKITVRELRRLAQDAGIDAQNEKYLWELAELAWTLHYRRITERHIFENTSERVDLTFADVVEFYQHVQPTFTGTDSVKKVFQQYSTSAPIAYLAGWFTDPTPIGRSPRVLEPSAGNGLLTIYYPTRWVTVNDLDPVRYQNLQGQDFFDVLHRDASEPFPEKFRRKFDVVLSNPPFGKLGEVNRDYGWAFKRLDHVMVAHALDCMRDDGRAAVLIGGHTEFDRRGHIAAFREFFNWLWRHYRVVDILNIDAQKLYHKQGTDFPLRLILIGGRKAEPWGGAPTLQNMPQLGEVIDTFEGLFDRIALARTQAARREETLTEKLDRITRQIDIELH